MRRLEIMIAAGWFLMLPPVSSKDLDLRYGIIKSTMKPLSEWTQYQSYDSVKECEAAKDAELRKAIDLSMKSTGQARAEKENRVQSFLASRCISSESPELLKQK